MNKKQSMVLTVIAYSFTLLVGFFLYYFFFQDYNLLYATFVIDVIMTALIFLFSLRYNNSSLYDPYWSVIPIFIVIFWIIILQNYSILSLLLFIGVLVWGIRLTVNWYWNFTGYQKEDFRYMDFRNQFKGLYWFISFLGIHLFPTIIVFVSLYPLYYIFTSNASNPIYIVLGTIIMISGAYISFVSDNQLRAHKKESPNQSIQSGLWKYSRHPNYFGEVSFWFGVYISSLSIGFALLPVIGFIGMLLLFNFYSVPKMEQKLLHNKSDYKDIIEQVPRFFIRRRKAD